MKEVNLTEIFQKFDSCCFELAKEEYYHDFDEFVDDVASNYAGLVVDVYGYEEDTLRRRIFEYLEDYSYRDPGTNMSKTFLEWSQFFNHEYELKKNLAELYEHCCKVNEELEACKQKIKELESQQANDETDNTPIHTKILSTLLDDETREAFAEVDKSITELGFDVIRLGYTEESEWQQYVSKELDSDAQESLDLSDTEWGGYLDEVWNFNFHTYGDITKTLKEWSEYYSQSDMNDDVEMEEGEEIVVDNATSNIATIEEMKREALLRMKEVIQYGPIIEAFEEDDLPQVYEPPYGASYALEDDELEHLREVEAQRNILIWGVIKCFMQYDRHQVSVDCYLHVSSDKGDWEKEREDLVNGIPFVYTYMKEASLSDYGHISIYQSQGGTLLRR